MRPHHLLQKDVYHGSIIRADVPESREKTVMSRWSFGEEGTFVRWNLSRTFGVLTSSGNCSKRIVWALARRTSTRPSVAIEALYAGVMLAEIRDAWAASHLVRLWATNDFWTHRAPRGQFNASLQMHQERLRHRDVSVRLRVCQSSKSPDFRAPLYPSANFRNADIEHSGEPSFAPGINLACFYTAASKRRHLPAASHEQSTVIFTIESGCWASL
ncbi:hypothetical protein QFZ91_006075 [Paraburkholderia sp. JPY419]